MAEGWYVSQNGNTTGPFTTAQIFEDVKAKKLGPDATVCAVGLTRFRKITEEPELAKAFEVAATPAALPQVAEPAKKVCPMPRIIAATTLLLSSAFWGTAAAMTVGKCPTTTASTIQLPCAVSTGVAMLASFLSLVLMVGVIRRKPRAHCGASAIHVGGMVASAALAKACCPMLLVVTGVHLLGLLAARGAKKQLCATTTSSCSSGSCSV